MSGTLLKSAIEQIENTIKFKKCHKCGCQQGTIRAIEKNLPNFSDSDQVILKSLIERAKATFQPIEYDCLGCKTCFPSIVTNDLMAAYPSVQIEDDGCASEDINVKEREGWPPLPGSFEIMRYQAPVAVCTLNSKEMMREIADTRHNAVSIVGSLNTENLGIERVIKNIVTNPHIRFLILCGEDSEQRIGHLPGQSFASLFENGIDSSSRIIGAQGKRPVLKNIASALIDQFRKQVQLVSMIGCAESAQVLEAAEVHAGKSPGAYQGGSLVQLTIPRIQAKPPSPLVLDPKGYFVIFPDRMTGKIVVEHYHNNGLLNQIIEGVDVGSIYMTIIELGIVSKLDHACYLGKELAKAEESLRTGSPYQQDKAQEAPEEVASNDKPRCGSSGCC